MADTKISNMTAASTLTGAELIAGVQSGANVKITADQQKTWSSNAPTLVTPVLGVATATSINKVALTAPASGSTLTIADGKTLTSSVTMTLQGGDASVLSIAAAKTLTASASITITGTDGKALTVTNSGTVAGGDAWVLAIAAGKTLTASNSLTFTGTDSTSFAFPSTSGSVAVLGAQSFTGQQTFAVGTTAIAPQVLQSGTNLTTAAVGAIEFDGKCFYQTAIASSRQVVGTEQFATTVTATTLANDNSTQSVFAAANDVLSLAAATTFQFECLYYINTGNTTHTTATAFAASSAFTSIQYWAELWSTTTTTISTTAPSVLDVAVSTATVLNATSTATRTTIRCRGIIRTNLASTVTPQVKFSADPTGTCEVAANSYFRIWPVGTNAVAAVGNWA